MSPALRRVRHRLLFPCAEADRVGAVPFRRRGPSTRQPSPPPHVPIPPGGGPSTPRSGSRPSGVLPRGEPPRGPGRAPGPPPRRRGRHRPASPACRPLAGGSVGAAPLRPRIPPRAAGASRAGPPALQAGLSRALPHAWRLRMTPPLDATQPARPEGFLYAPMFPLGADTTPYRKHDIGGLGRRGGWQARAEGEAGGAHRAHLPGLPRCLALLRPAHLRHSRTS